MGVGMVLIVEENEADTFAESLRNSGETVYEIGHTETGSQEVRLVHGG